MKKVCLASLLLLFALSLFAVDIVHHQIHVSLDPSKHMLKGRDQVSYAEAITSPDTFYVSADVRVKVKARQGSISTVVTTDTTGYQQIRVVPRKAANELVFEYSGEIYHSLKGRNLKEGHDFTTGMISQAEGEGVFLPVGSWYPVHNHDDLAHYDVEANCPKEIRLITSGREILQEEKNQILYRWKTELPTEGLTLSGNHFSVKELYYDQRRLAVYLLPEDAKLADLYLDSLKVIYKTYTSLLGPYPFSSFCMVENFFPSGFGMPNYTLLAKEIVKMPFIVTSPGSLAHEFCHNWWGNGVFVKPGTGNWCEALTTFCSNYFWNELKGRPEKALEYRRNAMYSWNQLAPEARYPLGQFEYQRTEDDAVIGYQQGTMFLYSLLRFAGHDEFIDALRAFAEHYEGKYATWMDLKSCLAGEIPTAENKDLDRIFQENLNRGQLPKFSIANVQIQDKKVVVEMKQKYPPSFIQVPFIIETDKQTKELLCTMSDTLATIRTNFLGLNETVERVVLDPEFEVMRIIAPDQMPFNLNRTLGDNPLLILPSKGESVGKLQMLVSMLKSSGFQCDAVSADSIQVDQLAKRNIMVFGKYAENPLIPQISGKLPDGFNVQKGMLTAKGKKYQSNKSSLLLSCPNIWNEGKLMTLYVWNDDAAVTSFRRLFHYQTQSWQVFDLVQQPNQPMDAGDIIPATGTDMEWERP